MYFYMCIRICVVTVWPKAEHPWILCTFDNQPCQRFWPLLLLEKVTRQPNVNGKYSTTTGGTMSIVHNINGVWSVLSVTQCEVRVFKVTVQLESLVAPAATCKQAPRSQPKLGMWLQGPALLAPYHNPGVVMYKIFGVKHGSYLTEARAL